MFHPLEIVMEFMLIWAMLLIAVYSTE
jgi:hypothetical protein